MSQPYVGEIRMFAGNFAPAGWALCNGQILAISENETLFNLIGTTYGGDGQSTFALPNLQSRIPIHVGPGFVQAQTGGAEMVLLTPSQMPSHAHVVQSSSAAGSSSNPANNFLASEGGSGSGNVSVYISAPTTLQAISPNTVVATGGSQPHDNMVPFLTINFILSLFGIFPSQT
jgi:microcystin-dependent protein